MYAKSGRAEGKKQGKRESEATETKPWCYLCYCREKCALLVWRRNERVKCEEKTISLIAQHIPLLWVSAVIISTIYLFIECASDEAQCKARRDTLCVASPWNIFYSFPSVGVAAYFIEQTRDIFAQEQISVGIRKECANSTLNTSMEKKNIVKC